MSKVADARQKVMDNITDSVISQMKKGVMPWEAGWARIGLQHNHKRAHRPYRVINQFTLAIWAIENEWTSNKWGTFKEWSETALAYAKKHGLYQTDDDGNPVLDKLSLIHI